MITKRERRLQYQRGIAGKLLDRARALIAEAKDCPCADCKTRYPVFVMDFDHRPGVEKLFNIGASLKKYASQLDVLRAEIAKCDVVCANCHRIRTFGREQHKLGGVKPKEGRWYAKGEKKNEEPKAESLRPAPEPKPPAGPPPSLVPVWREPD